MLGEDDAGKWASSEFAFIVSRQNGKGSVLMARELAGLFLFDEQLIMHTAHEFKTSQESFLRVAEIIDNNPELVKQLKGGRLEKGKRTSHGEEGYELATGARLRFIARSKSSGRGFSADVVIMDEALELPEKAVAALQSVKLTRPNPQFIYTSSAPTDTSLVLRKLRKRGLSGNEKRFGFLEWSAPEEAFNDLANVEHWATANPALGYLYGIEALEDLYNGRMSDEDFARENLSIVDDLLDEELITAENWADAMDASSQRAGKSFRIGISVAPQNKAASISIAAKRSDGRFHVQVVHQQRTTKDFVKRVAEVVERKGGIVHLNAAGAAGSMILDLQDAGVKVEAVNGREYAQACGALAKAVSDDELRHLGQPSLNMSLKHAKARKLGDLWSWATSGDADLTPLEAVTLALQGFRSSLVEEQKPSKVSYEMYSYS